MRTTLLSHAKPEKLAIRPCKTGFFSHLRCKSGEISQKNQRAMQGVKNRHLARGHLCIFPPPKEGASLFRRGGRPWRDGAVPRRRLSPPPAARVKKRYLSRGHLMQLSATERRGAPFDVAGALGGMARSPAVVLAPSRKTARAVYGNDLAPQSRRRARFAILRSKLHPCCRSLRWTDAFQKGALDCPWNGDSRLLMRKPGSELRAPT